MQEKDGFALGGRVDRYEGLKVVQTDFSPAEEVKIYHVPSIDFSGLDHPIPGTPLLWSVAASTAGLKRVQPNFATAGLTWRLDLRPEISLPLRFDGWHVLASAAVRETAYTRSRQTPYGNNATPVESDQGINRADVDLSVDIRPPTLERTFTVSPAGSASSAMRFATPSSPTSPIATSTASTTSSASCASTRSTSKATPTSCSTA